MKSDATGTRGRCGGLALSAAVLLLVAFHAAAAGRSVPPQPSPTGQPPVYRWTPGERHVYAIDYRNVSRSDFEALFEEKASRATRRGAEGFSPLRQRIESSLKGNLEIAVISSDEKGIRAVFRVTRPVVTLVSNGRKAAAEARTIGEHLGLEALALLTPRGKIVSVRLDPKSDPLSNGFARTIMAQTQFVVPAGTDNAAGWETEEEDPAGSYVALYKVSPPGKGKKRPSAAETAFGKTVLRYLPVKRKSRGGPYRIEQNIIPRGTLEARFDVAAGRLASIGGEERRTVVMGTRTVGSSRTTVRIRHVKTERMGTPEADGLRERMAALSSSSPAIPLSFGISGEEVEENIQRQKLGADTVETLLAAIRESEDSTDPKTDDTPLYLKLKALVHLHPEACGPLGEILARKDVRQRTLHLLAGVFGTVGHEKAQEALASAIRAHRGNRAALLVLLPMSGKVDEPTGTTVDALEEAAFGSEDPTVVGAAKLALGIAARKLRDSSPQRADRIVDRFLPLLAAPASDDDALLGLLVLGNAGSPRALPAIRRYLASPSPILRASAHRSLVWIPGEEVDGLLANALGSDADNNVRLQAAVAMSVREMGDVLFRAQKTALQKDENPKVRLQAMSNLWNARGSSPEVQKLVGRAAETDADGEVRKAARELLATYLP